MILLSLKSPYRFTHARSVEYSSLTEALAWAESQGTLSVGLAYSGMYYVLRADGWYQTSDSSTTDTECGLPFDGRKL